MNEKIKQLWDNSIEEFSKQHQYATIMLPEPLREKFAELIVRECADQIIAKGTDWIDFAPSWTGVRPEYWDMAQQIKEHFGVEE